jgi:chitin disaccharide deacetylase
VHIRKIEDRLTFSSEARSHLLRSSVVLLALSTLSICPAYAAAQPDVASFALNPNQAYLVIRADDGGMSHSVNMALEKLINTGLPVSVSVMFPTPWYQETVEMLKQHPNVAVGIHLTLNSEWKNYRWGPVLGRTAVPSLVDADGYFFPSSDALDRNHPDLAQVEAELRAQIERAMHSGLKIAYVDYHMGTVFDNPRFREIAERLAKEYSLGMMHYFGEPAYNPQYDARPQDKTDSVVALTTRLKPGFTVLVTHVGIDNAELGALLDMNANGGLPEMSKNRQGELDAMTSQRFRDALKARNIQLLTYRQLIAMQGLQSMRRPAE